jgi:hypothetical protein
MYIREDDRSTAASIATVLLVVLVAAMMTIVSFFLFGIVKIPEDPPTVEVVYSQLNDRWSVHISDVSEEERLSDYRLIVHHEDGSLVMYDPDQDGVADTLMVMTLDELLDVSGGGAMEAPIQFLDVDGDGKMSSGDVMVAHSNFIPSNSLFMDSTRGNRIVSTDPHGIPLDSDLVIVSNSITLVTSGLQPGDEVSIVVKHGSTVEATRTGFATASGDYITEVYLDPSWHNGNHKVDFTIRPGEVDEWIDQYMFKALDPDPPTAEEAEAYEALKHPLVSGDVVSLIHVPTNAVVLEFRL